MASLGERDGHGREQTGLKATKRIVEKAALRPGEGRGRTDRVCDVVRAMLVAKDMRTVGAIAEALCALQAAGLIELRRIKDHFIFTIESTGMLPPEVLFQEALKILCEKVGEVSARLKDATT